MTSEGYSGREVAAELGRSGATSVYKAMDRYRREVPPGKHKVENVETRAAILDLIASGGTVQQVARVTNLTLSTVRGYLRLLERDGFVVRAGRLPKAGTSRRSVGRGCVIYRTTDKWSQQGGTRCI